MKTFETKLTVYTATLFSAYREAVNGDVNFDNAFECEVGWMAQSGITLNDYVVTPKDDRTVIVDALFDVDEDILSECSEGSLGESFRSEFGWLEESGIYLDSTILA